MRMWKNLKYRWLHKWQGDQSTKRSVFLFFACPKDDPVWVDLECMAGIIYLIVIFWFLETFVMPQLISLEQFPQRQKIHFRISSEIYFFTTFDGKGYCKCITALYSLLNIFFIPYFLCYINASYCAFIIWSMIFEL